MSRFAPSSITITFSRYPGICPRCITARNISILRSFMPTRRILISRTAFPTGASFVKSAFPPTASFFKSPFPPATFFFNTAFPAAESFLTTASPETAFSKIEWFIKSLNTKFSSVRTKLIISFSPNFESTSFKKSSYRFHGVSLSST